jgi:hypothetical protein
MQLLPGRRPASAAEGIPPRLRTPRAAAWWIVPTALVVGGVVGGVAWLLLAAGWSVTEAAARQGAIQTALAAGAGVGAAVTLMLAFRRQRHQEHAAHVTAFLAEQVAEHNRHDAIERRVTDLYVKAAEQLGHDKAAVRLAGIYALERLGQDNPGHRQTVVNVLCAYLRMPFTPPPDPVPDPVPDPGQERAAALQAARRRYRGARPGATAAVPAPSGKADDREGELQVRLTAQRILAAHVRDDRTADQHPMPPAAPALWEDMRLDLTGAALVDFDLTDGRVAAAGFERARFYGPARFHRTTFCGEAAFNGATFIGDAWFNYAAFRGDAGFNGATFCGRAWFLCAAFSGNASFRRAAFRESSMGSVPGAAMFDEATFGGFAEFGQSTFAGVANFNQAAFSGDAWFNETGLLPRGWVRPYHLLRRRPVPHSRLLRTRHVRERRLHRERRVHWSGLRRGHLVRRGGLHRGRLVQRGLLLGGRGVRQGGLLRAGQLRQGDVRDRRLVPRWDLHR